MIKDFKKELKKEILEEVLDTLRDELEENFQNEFIKRVKEAEDRAKQGKVSTYSVKEFRKVFK